MNADLSPFLLPDFRVRQRDSLLEISRVLTQELDIDNLLRRMLLISVDILGGQAGLIALRSEKGEWGVRASHGLTSEFIQSVKPVLAAIPKENDSQQLNDQNELARINLLLQKLVNQASLGLLTGVGLPMINRKKVVGMIFIFRASQSLFSQNDREVLSSFASQAAIAIQNAQLYTEVIREKQRMDGLLESVGDGIMIMAPDHTIERCNHAFRFLIGVASDFMEGKSHNDVIRIKGNPKGLTLEQAEAGGWPLTKHAQLYLEADIVRFADNAIVPVGITYAPLLSADGRLQNIIVSLRDISRFRQADEIKSTFISIISHELKTPVALIKGYVSTLRREDANWDSDVVQDSLAVIEDEADRLTHLIENLLEASRLEAGGVGLKRSDMSLKKLVEKTCERFKTQTNSHTFVLDFPEFFPIILADENRIRQVLNNLISNAIKYSPGGEIRVTGSVRADMVIICVADQGPGITPNDAPHIFDRFYRAPEMARHTQGAGLGLYLTRSIIEAHDGRIWVDTSADEGARICFSLPRDEDEEDEIQ
ncbi:MAG: GAF domain-containing protein [Anaerolineaceae bacterium]|nr:GAF domain-containing protein [Anaerolineaceae bacterium]